MAAVAEVGDQALWQRSALGGAVVTRLPSIVMKSWPKFVNFIEGPHGGQLLDYQMEVH